MEDPLDSVEGEGEWGKKSGGSKEGRKSCDFLPSSVLPNPNHVIAFPGACVVDLFTTGLSDYSDTLANSQNCH